MYCIACTQECLHYLANTPIFRVHAIAVYTAYLNYSELALKTFATEKNKNVIYLLLDVLWIFLLLLDGFSIEFAFSHVAYSRAYTYSRCR